MRRKANRHSLGRAYFSPRFERLETRAMMAGVTTAVLSGNQLQVTGTDGNDEISFYRSGKYIHIQGIEESWKASKVESIFVDSMGGDDVVSFDSLANGGDVLLEDVVLLDAADLGPEPSAALVDKQLQVTGTNGDDEVNVFQYGKYIYVQGMAGYWKASKVDSIYVDWRGGTGGVSFDSLANGGNEALDGIATYDAVGVESTLSVALNEKQLQVTGTDGDDEIRVFQFGKYVYIYGVAGSWKGSKIDSIFVDWRGGTGGVSFDSLANGGNEALDGIATYDAVGVESTLSVALNEKQLQVTGTDGDDEIRVFQFGKYVYIHGVAGSWKASKIDSIFVDWRGGDGGVSFDSLANGGDKTLDGIATFDAFGVETSLSVVLVGKQLQVTGTNGDDVIRVFQYGKYVYVHGVAGVWKASNLDSIFVDSMNGDDLVSFDSLANGGDAALDNIVTLRGLDAGDSAFCCPQWQAAADFRHRRR